MGWLLGHDGRTAADDRVRLGTARGPIHKRFGKPGAKYQNLAPLKHADLAAWCMRACLEAGMAQQVAYR